MIKRWFTTLPTAEEYETDDWEYRKRWYNWHYEHGGTRVRVIVGDLAVEPERENGEPEPPTLQLELTVLEPGYGEFPHLDGKLRYDVHHFLAVVWRWGIYLAIRGRTEK